MRAAWVGGGGAEGGAFFFSISSPTTAGWHVWRRVCKVFVENKHPKQGGQRQSISISSYTDGGDGRAAWVGGGGAEGVAFFFPIFPPTTAHRHVWRRACKVFVATGKETTPVG